ncbi:hypothetical protein Hanom_Chr14g01302381 [Helianthus anomalus]
MGEMAAYVGRRFAEQGGVLSGPLIPILVDNNDKMSKEHDNCSNKKTNVQFQIIKMYSHKPTKEDE